MPFFSRKTRRDARVRSVRRNSPLRLEMLEDRCVLATFLVNTLADTLDADPAVTSLRKAITDANSQAGDDIINFSVTGTINLTGALPDLSSNIQILGPGRRQFDSAPGHRRRLPHLYDRAAHRPS